MSNGIGWVRRGLIRQFPVEGYGVVRFACQGRRWGWDVGRWGTAPDVYFKGIMCEADMGMKQGGSTVKLIVLCLPAGWNSRWFDSCCLDLIWNDGVPMETVVGNDAGKRLGFQFV